jgi:hypothetical protein
MLRVAEAKLAWRRGNGSAVNHQVDRKVRRKNIDGQRRFEQFGSTQPQPRCRVELRVQRDDLVTHSEEALCHMRPDKAACPSDENGARHGVSPNSSGAIWDAERV